MEVNSLMEVKIESKGVLFLVVEKDKHMLKAKVIAVQANADDGEIELLGKELPVHLCSGAAGPCSRSSGVKALHVDALRLLTVDQAVDTSWMKLHARAIKKAVALPEVKATFADMLSISDMGGHNRPALATPAKVKGMGILKDNMHVDFVSSLATPPVKPVKKGSQTFSIHSPGLDMSPGEEPSTLEKKAKAVAKIAYLQALHGIEGAQVGGGRHGDAEGADKFSGGGGVTPMQKHEGQPGRLAEKYVNALNLQQYKSKGVKPVLAVYFELHVLPKITATRDVRELLTLAKSGDYLLAIPDWISRKEVGQSLDVVCQRMKAIEWANTMLKNAESRDEKRAAWVRAAELELIPETNISAGLESNVDLEQASKRFREKEKWKTLAKMVKVKGVSSDSSDEDEGDDKDAKDVVKKKKKRMRSKSRTKDGKKVKP